LIYLKKLLNFNPEKRNSAEECLEHSYVSQFHSKEDETKCDHLIQVPINDNKKLTVSEYRNELYTTILKINVEKKEIRATKKKTSKSKSKRDSKKKFIKI